MERPNRFLVRVRLAPIDPRGLPGAANVADAADPVVEAHLPDPGRLKELLLPGARVWLRPASGTRRRTRWTAVLVERPDGRGAVSMDTGLPNRLILKALEAGALEELAAWRLVRTEWSHAGSRFDFLLEDGQGRCLVLEVKSVTLVEEGVGLFPDAVTARGRRHVEELAEIAGRAGWEAAVLFVLQRPDADRIVAAPAIDPAFAEALAAASEAGVRILGRRCRVGPDRVVLGAAVPAGAHLP